MLVGSYTLTCDESVKWSFVGDYPRFVFYCLWAVAILYNCTWARDPCTSLRQNDHPANRFRYDFY